MVPTLLSDIVALPGWNAPMLLLLAKATVILLSALGITIAMQRGSAGARHLVWLVTLGTLLLVPAVTAWVPPLRMEILPAAKRVESVAPAPRKIDRADPNVAAPAPALSTGTSSNTSPRETASSPVGAASAQLSSMSGISLLLTLWAGIALALGLWLAWGALAVRRIVRNAHPLDTQDWLTPLWEVADRLELDEAPQLLGSNEAKMPFACGLTKPIIVLPADCEQWSNDRRRAVLLHELAHVKRHDLVGHTLGRLACAVYWFHPLVWTAARRLRNESERACDDLAISCGARASDYAEHLLDIVTSVRGDSTPALALAMARRKEFEGRMLAILDPDLRHSTPSRRQSLTLVGSLAAIAIVVGAAAPAPRPSQEKPVVTLAPASANERTPNDEVQLDADMPKYSDAASETSASSIASAAAESVVGATVNAIAKATVGSVQASIEKTSQNLNVKTQVNTVSSPRVVLSGDDGVALRALERLGIDAGTAQQKGGRAQTDDRPVLLANILRTDSDPSLRRIAAWGLSEYADMQVASDALSTALRRDSDASVREMSAWALAEGNHNSTGMSALTAAIRGDANENVRAIATWALGEVGEEDAVDVLVSALSDRSSKIRMRAIWAIGNVEPEEAPKALFPLLRDPDPEVRELTAWALYQIEDPASVPYINAALKTETNKELQIAYIKALAAMGEKSVDAIRGLLTSSDPKIKSMAVRALAGGSAAGPWPWPWPEPRPFP
jgi:beta-lactamase regulating signal transducer with metallopeptidase domain/HEAT repeat protein